MRKILAVALLPLCAQAQTHPDSASLGGGGDGLLLLILALWAYLAVSFSRDAFRKSDSAGYICVAGFVGASVAAIAVPWLMTVLVAVMSLLFLAMIGHALRKWW